MPLPVSLTATGDRITVKLGRDVHLTLTANSLGGVDQQVHPDLIELSGVTIYWRQLGVVAVEHDAVRRRNRREQTNGRINAFMNIDLLELRFVETRKESQVLDHIADSLRAFATVEMIELRSPISLS